MLSTWVEMAIQTILIIIDILSLRAVYIVLNHYKYRESDAPIIIPGKDGTHKILIKKGTKIEEVYKGVLQWS